MLLALDDLCRVKVSVWVQIRRIEESEAHARIEKRLYGLTNGVQRQLPLSYSLGYAGKERFVSTRAVLQVGTLTI
jgi:hypothetical protein